VALPPNPFLTSVFAHKNYLLLEKETTDMLIAMNVGQSGFPYSDAAETLGLYEYRQVDPISKRVGVRTSFKILWLNKPLFLEGIFTRLCTQKVNESVNFYMAFQLS
jgi:hypothetical protein